jgi:hypothetical protein
MHHGRIGLEGTGPPGRCRAARADRPGRRDRAGWGGWPEPTASLAWLHPVPSRAGCCPIAAICRETAGAPDRPAAGLLALGPLGALRSPGPGPPGRRSDRCGRAGEGPRAAISARPEGHEPDDPDPDRADPRRYRSGSPRTEVRSCSTGVIHRRNRSRVEGDKSREHTESRSAFLDASVDPTKRASYRDLPPENGSSGHG